MADILNKKICLQKPIQNTFLDEIRVIKNIVDFRISAVESKIDFLIATCTSIFSNSELLKSQHKDHVNSLNSLSEQLLYKIRNIEELLSTIGLGDSSKSGRHCGSDGDNSSFKSDVIISTGDELVMKLPNVDDFPNGSWLGDESDLKHRVRVNIDPSVLIHINEQCTTPEKMALILVDTLFPRDVLAISNLSGKGRHCKQQLDPVLIYGVKCHLKYTFDISDIDWYRIKRNIDSKCRTIWRRKKRGLPLGKKKASSSAASLCQSDQNDYDSSDDCSEQVVCYEVLDSQKVNDIAPDKDIELSSCKPPSEDDFQLLPPVQLFTVEATDCFMLQGNELVIPDGIIKDVNRHHDFLNK